ncbi:uncharacterized protein LOC118803490 [Colossoma macropomum]|uniref:uncharacterized protein LOC118803490 n=1 Tax=Colossoma macropomum TaxID=42526 RepID=UPI0018652FCB|nr:uncharacterized protein LOC118803490 [Colossoma macropomum]
MLLTFYLLFIGLHVSEGCTLVNREKLLNITAHTGGSVLLPCYCADLHTTPEGFSWKKDDTKTKAREVISSESGQYRNRVQLFNSHSPGNLSLLISHLTEEDGGVYYCAVKGAHLVIRLTLKEGPAENTTFSISPDDHSTSTHFFIVIPFLLLLLGIGGVIFWRRRGLRQGQTESQEQGRVNREQKSQDEVMYSTIDHSKTPTTPRVFNIREKTEYTTIRNLHSLCPLSPLPW